MSFINILLVCQAAFKNMFSSFRKKQIAMSTLTWRISDEAVFPWVCGGSTRGTLANITFRSRPQHLEHSFLYTAIHILSSESLLPGVVYLEIKRVIQNAPRCLGVRLGNCWFVRWDDDIVVLEENILTFRRCTVKHVGIKYNDISNLF